jgi:hypothetical protein
MRCPSLYGSSIENTYAGVLSFMRRKCTREPDGVDVVQGCRTRGVGALNRGNPAQPIDDECSGWRRPSRKPNV